MKRFWTAALALALILTLFGGAAAESAAQIAPAKCGYLAFNSQTEEDIEEFTLGYNGIPIDALYFESYDELLAALEDGTIEYAYTIDPVGRYMQARDAALFSNPFDLMTHTALLLRAGDEALLEKCNAALTAMREQGAFEALAAAYIEPVIAGSDPESLKPVDLFPDAADDFDDMATLSARLLSCAEDAETIKVAVTGDLPPFDYVAEDGTPCGFNVAMLYGLGKALGVNIELVHVDAGKREDAVLNGEVDMAFWALGHIFEGDEADFSIDAPEGTVATVPYYETKSAMVFPIPAQ